MIRNNESISIVCFDIVPTLIKFNFENALFATALNGGAVIFFSEIVSVVKFVKPTKAGQRVKRPRCVADGLASTAFLDNDVNSNTREDVAVARRLVV